MSEETGKFESWGAVIVDFFENKVAQSDLYKARDYISKKDIEIESEKNLKKLDRLKNARQKKYQELMKLRREAPSTAIRDWIEKASDTKIVEGKRIIKASHVLKFTHGSSSSDGVLANEKSSDVPLFTTSSFKKELTYDLAHNNGALITVSRFLALKISGKHIIDLILEGDFDFLNPFYKDKRQLDKWKDGLKNLVEHREIKTADKAKQIYFPLIQSDSQMAANNLRYHLVTPLFPSAVAEEIYAIITDLKYGKVQKEVRECKKEKGDSAKKTKFHGKPSVEIPNLGIQTFGGAQPQNISMLNKGRRGMTYLFSTQPPTWHSQLKPPIHRRSLFDVLYNSVIDTEIGYLRDFLLRFKQLDLSIKDPKRIRHLERWVNNIIDELLFYVGTIQNLPAGWSDSESIRLKKTHQYLLDPYRMDQAFQSARQGSDWQAVIRADFSMWLNRQLRGKDQLFTPQKEHSRLWKKLLETPLREFMEPIESEIKQQAREPV